MIKLSDLIESNEQPGEESKMKNFLYRGSRDQINLHPNKYTVVGSKPGFIETPESPIPSNGRPENRNRVVPFQWDQSDGMFEDNQNNVQQALIGREFQTIEDTKKIVSRLRDSGYSEESIQHFISTYIFS